jgi:uncharacterized membrane protein YraQ (UPF0718 family)
MKDNKKNKDKKYVGKYFLVSVILLYFILSIFNPNRMIKALKASGNILIQILPVFVIVIVLMGVTNYFLKPTIVSKYAGKSSGIKGWVFAIFTGIISHGPIYVWYPLLKDLRDKGMRNGLISVFLYNRAIKIPLLPLMVYYFGMKFVVVLLIYMIVASIIGGKIIEIIDRRK